MSQIKSVSRNLGQPKQKWTEEEEQALKLGVKRYGVGKWRLIQKDECCGPVLANRSNVDLKDKWRNLNMEARDKDQAKSLDDDPDFQKENQRRKRRCRRSSLHSCTVAAEVATSSGRSEDQDIEQGVSTDMACDDHDWTASLPNAMSDMHCQEPYAQDHHIQAPDVPDMHISEHHESQNLSPTSGHHGPLIEDMVVAAVISLQNPLGSGPDEICTWIEEHYHAADRHHVQVIMTDLIKAGRLQLCSQHPSLVCMGGVLGQLARQGSVAMHLDPLSHDDESSHLFQSDKIVAEQALLAAQAVMQAEEASRKASSLLEAAHQLYELEHTLACRSHDDMLTQL